MHLAEFYYIIWKKSGCRNCTHILLFKVVLVNRVAEFIGTHCLFCGICALPAGSVSKSINRFIAKNLWDTPHQMKPCATTFAQMKWENVQMNQITSAAHLMQ